MATLPTRADLFDIGASEIFGRSQNRPPGQRLSAEEVFTEGSDINIVTAGAAAMGDEALNFLCGRIAALFLDSAEGEDLDRLVQDRFSPTIRRKEATPAVVTLEYTRVTGVLGPISEGIGKKLRTENGTEFELQQVMSMAAGSTGPISVIAQATGAGTAGNVSAETITQFVDAPSDVNLVVTNLAVAAGGADVETDASLRARARDFFRTARRGTLAAIEFGALTVQGVAQATAVEVVDAATGRPTGPIQLSIADANGQANEILADAVERTLLEFRAGGIIVDVLPSTPVFVTIKIQPNFASGFSASVGVDDVKGRFVNLGDRQAPGQGLLLSALYEQIRLVPGAIVTLDWIQEPTDDLAGIPGRSFRIQLSDIEVI